MSGIKYLLDTCFIIELYNGKPEVLATVQSKQIDLPQCGISPINRMEVLGFNALPADDENNLNNLLDSLVSFPINRQIENKTIELRKNHKIKLPDCIVLATALTHGLQLLTLDEKLDRRYKAELAGE